MQNYKNLCKYSLIESDKSLFTNAIIVDKRIWLEVKWIIS